MEEAKLDMKKVKFAKIFEHKDFQVLAQKVHFGSENAYFSIFQTTFWLGDDFVSEIRFENELERDKEFKNYSLVSALAFLEEVLTETATDNN